MRARDKTKNFIDVIYEQKSGLSAAFLDKLLLPDLRSRCNAKPTVKIRFMLENIHFRTKIFALKLRKGLKVLFSIKAVEYNGQT